MKQAIATLSQTIQNIEKEINTTSILDVDKIKMLSRAKSEAIKCLNTLKYVAQ